jgi:hypothetical protein
MTIQEQINKLEKALNNSVLNADQKKMIQQKITELQAQPELKQTDPAPSEVKQKDTFKFKRGDILLSENNIWLCVSDNPYKLTRLNDKMKPESIYIDDEEEIENIFKKGKKIAFANTQAQKSALTGYFTINDLKELSDFKYSVPKELEIKFNPTDKNLWNILKNIVGKDDLRPLMTGINLDDSGATATNAHLLIHLPGNTDKKGIYDIYGREIEGNYPQYKAVIPRYKNEDLINVNVAELYNLSKIYKKSIINNYGNIKFKTKDQDIVLNNELLYKFTEALLKIKNNGWKAYITAPNKAILFIYDNNTETQTDDVIALQMPIIANFENNYGYINIEFNIESNVSFDFEKNTVFEKDKLITLNSEAPKEQKQPKLKSSKTDKNQKTQDPEQPKTDINQEIKTLKEKRPVKGKTEQPTEERTKEQIKADYDAQLAAIQEKYKNDFASLTESEVILIGLKLNAQRSLYSQFVDNASDNKRRLSPTPENLLRWMQKPGYFDLIGVDTFERTDQTKDYKKLISKQKIFNLFGIKV